MARRFVYVALGILALSAAYHLGAARTEAQGGGQFVGISANAFGTTLAITSGGDVYARERAEAIVDGCQVQWFCPTGEWIYMGNVLSGPTPAESQSFGSVKNLFRR